VSRRYAEKLAEQAIARAKGRAVGTAVQWADEIEARAIDGAYLLTAVARSAGPITAAEAAGQAERLRDERRAYYEASPDERAAAQAADPPTPPKPPAHPGYPPDVIAVDCPQCGRAAGEACRNDVAGRERRTPCYARITAARGSSTS
jgi:hypothetical protein